MNDNDLISRAAFRSSIQTVLNDTTCPIHIAAEIEQYLELEPTVDAVPVVRCKDCKHGKLCFDANGQGLIQCTNPYYPASFAGTWPFDLDWYCAGGERRDSE